MQKLKYLPFNKVTKVFNNEENALITSTLNKKYTAYLEDERFFIDTGFSKNQVQLLVALEKNDNSFQYPLECVYVGSVDEQLAKKIALLILDYVDIYWGEYFSDDRNVFVPLDWSKHEVEGHSFYIRGFVRILHLENQANELLSKHGHGQYDISSISSEV